MMGATPRNLHEVNGTGESLRQAPIFSIAGLTMPVVMVGSMLVATVLVGMWIGRLADKVDTVVQTTNEIKQGQYTQADAAKDLALVHTEIGDVRRRVETLEQAQHHQVALVQARQSEREARNDDFVTRASKWLSGTVTGKK